MTGGMTATHDMPDSAKNILRRRARAARRTVSGLERGRASAEIARRALALPELARAGTVLLYGAAPEEVDVSAIETALRAKGVTIAYPRVETGGALAAHVVTGPQDCAPGAFGITEPCKTAAELPVETIEAVIVPGVAFDEDCNRLGFGGGYYDRLIARLTRDVPVIGVAYDVQVVETVPCDAHDRPVDILVTPSRTVRRATTTP